MSLTPRYKIALYDPYTIGFGGLYRYVQGILRALDPGQFDVTLFCHPNMPFETTPQMHVRPVLPAIGHPFMGAGKPVAQSFSGSARCKAPLSMRRLLAYVPRPPRIVAGFVRSALRIAPLFRGQEFDLVHTFETDADPATLAARLAGVRRVLYTYQVDSTYRSEAEQRCLGNRLTEIITDRCLTLGLAASERTRQDRLARTRVPPGRIITIPNGIDTSYFKRTMSRTEARAKTGLPDDGRFLIGVVGRLHEHKGHEFLFRAVSLLNRRDAHLVVVGSGGLEQPLRELAHSLNITGQVTFLGQRSDILELLQSFELFALPSLCEALPYALLEAMSVNLACIATDVGGNRELIEEGKSGFIVPAKDPKAFAERLNALLESEELRDQFGLEARSRVVSHFHEADRIWDTIRLYRSALELDEMCSAETFGAKLADAR